eukprot:1775570-Alexandrium_andersonii.AAC.1
MRRCEPCIDPAFSTTTWARRSLRMLCASRAMSGAAQNRMDEGPHTPRAPAVRPAKVRSWHGDPATMSSREPSGTSPRARRRPSAPLWTMSQTSPARRRYGASP